MKRAIFFGGMVIYNFLITLIANDLSISNSGTVIPDTTTTVGFNLGFLEDIMVTFGDMLTFNLEGIPAPLIILFIYIPNLILLIVIISFIFNRD